MDYSYEMPTRLFIGPLANHASEFGGNGRCALIVTGRSSAKNGALADTLAALRTAGAEAVVFDRTEENPSVENVITAAREGIAAGADFVIGLGGGSAMDAAKAVALLLKEPEADENALYDPHAFAQGFAPMLAIPTTAGTGSEVTPFSVITRHSHRTKITLPHRIFPAKAFIDARYTYTMPERLTLHTAVDALAHLVEGYLSSRANPLSDRMAEGGLAGFGGLREALTSRRFDEAVRDELMNLSTLAGIVLAQAKTSLPHLMGYALTYFKNIPHGAACGLLTAEYLRFHEDKKKTDRLLTLLGLSDYKHLKEWLRELIQTDEQFSKDDIAAYVGQLCKTPEKFKAHPFAGSVTPEALTAIYQNSLL